MYRKMKVLHIHMRSSRIAFRDNSGNTTLKCGSEVFGCFNNAVSIVLGSKIGSVNI